MKIKLAFAAATLMALVVVSCTPNDQQVHPFCAEAVGYWDTCIEVADPVAQTGWLLHSDGSDSPEINYWLDGTVEIH